MIQPPDGVGQGKEGLWKRFNAVWTPERSVELKLKIPVHTVKLMDPEVWAQQKRGSQSGFDGSL